MSPMKAIQLSLQWKLIDQFPTDRKLTNDYGSNSFCPVPVVEKKAPPTPARRSMRLASRNENKTDDEVKEEAVKSE